MILYCDSNTAAVFLCNTIIFGYCNSTAITTAPKILLLLKFCAKYLSMMSLLLLFVTITSTQL